MDHGALLEQFVFDQAKTVSYKWLSSELAIPAAGAKRCAAASACHLMSVLHLNLKAYPS